MNLDLKQILSSLQGADGLVFLNAARDARNSMVLCARKDPRYLDLIRLIDEHLSEVWNTLACPECDGCGVYYEECDVCGGTGYAACEACSGTGVSAHREDETSEAPCKTCGGSGDDTTKGCEWCHGDAERAYECDECDGDGVNEDVLARWKEAKDKIVVSPLWKQQWLPLQEIEL